MKKYLKILSFLLLIGMFAAGCTSSTKSTDTKVDVDLSELSTTLIQAEFQRIISNPNDYIGKTIKATGAYRTIHYDGTDTASHFIIIVSGDECCEMGLEFILSDEYTYPDDFPVQNTNIEVIGVLEIQEKFGSVFMYIAAESFTVKGE